MKWNCYRKKKGEMLSELQLVKDNRARAEAWLRIISMFINFKRYKDIHGFLFD
jgi:hypothetical protein